jgi:four helix bundle protein
MRRARSRREFAAKLQIVNEEVDECVYWLELVTRRPAALPTAQVVLEEARELRAIFAKARAD